MDAFLQSQIPFVLALQQLTALTAPMEFFSFLGSEEFFLILLPLVYLGIDAGAGARLAFVLLFGNSLSWTLKLAFHLPRPYWFDARVLGLATETSYGLPSGHAQNATGVWLFLASTFGKHPFDTLRVRASSEQTLSGAQAKPKWQSKGAWVTALVVIALISFSRIYLGVHFPMDVIGGWLFGGLFLMAFLWLEPKATQRLDKIGFWGQVAAATGVAALVVVIGLITRALIAGSPDPENWAAFAAGARTLDGLFTSAGSIFGVGVGLAMANRWARFNAGGPLGKRAARFVVGLVGVLIFWAGLRVIFPREPETVALVFRFVRYGLATWWAIFLAPWLFLKFNLAEARS
jgi:membrane-associated phospholipid phosphatase